MEKQESKSEGSENTSTTEKKEEEGNEQSSSQQSSLPKCLFFSKTGSCVYGQDCRFLHEDAQQQQKEGEEGAGGLFFLPPIPSPAPSPAFVHDGPSSTATTNLSSSGFGASSFKLSSVDSNPLPSGDFRGERTDEGYFQSLLASPEYRGFSNEELRWKDYATATTSAPACSTGPARKDDTDQQELIEAFRGMLDHGLYFADVTFDVGGQHLRAHRNILSARCAKFRAMFSSSLREGSPNVEITIHETTPQTFKELLRYCYTGQVTFTGMEMAAELLQLAEEYLLPSLKSKCATCLISCINDETVIGLFDLARMYSVKSLKEECMNYIVDKFDDITARDDFMHLEKGVIVEILGWACSRVQMSSSSSTFSFPSFSSSKPPLFGFQPTTTTTPTTPTTPTTFTTTATTNTDADGSLFKGLFTMPASPVTPFKWGMTPAPPPSFSSSSVSVSVTEEEGGYSSFHVKGPASDDGPSSPPCSPREGEGSSDDEGDGEGVKPTKASPPRKRRGPVDGTPPRKD